LGVLLGHGRKKRNGKEGTASFESATQIAKFTQLQAASPIDVLWIPTPWAGAKVIAKKPLRMARPRRIGIQR
jgi:hypothetical protein